MDTDATQSSAVVAKRRPAARGHGSEQPGTLVTIHAPLSGRNLSGRNPEASIADTHGTRRGSITARAPRPITRDGLVHAESPDARATTGAAHPSTRGHQAHGTARAATCSPVAPISAARTADTPTDHSDDGTITTTTHCGTADPTTCHRTASTFDASRTTGGNWLVNIRRATATTVSYRHQGTASGHATDHHAPSPTRATGADHPIQLDGADASAVASDTDSGLVDPHTTARRGPVASPHRPTTTTPAVAPTHNQRPRRVVATADTHISRRRAH